jgi:hypothetical protein
MWRWIAWAHYTWIFCRWSAAPTSVKLGDVLEAYGLGKKKES